ncbi:MAG: L,D-transpeptidase [Polyangiaceae bacterium]|nr:L,D-transpeptidase [Polyangiaceae bacterium]
MHSARLLLVTLSAAFALSFSDAPAHAEPYDELPPWAENGDLPVPSWARSVAPNRADAAIYARPGRLDARRGSAQLGARLPLYATLRANGCQGRWLEVGPLAWICSDVADYSADDPVTPSLHAAHALPSLDATPDDDGLPYRYYFAGPDGASGFMNLETALDDAPDLDLEPGFAVAIVGEQSAHGETWGKTKKGRWIAMRELIAARPSTFHGELLAGGALDFAWISADNAKTFAEPKPGKPTGSRARFERVTIYEKETAKSDVMLRVSEDSAPAVWMRARDLSRPTISTPPVEAGGETSKERWMDVDLTQQTLVAYEGTTPVFATLVSTGRGPAGSDFATNVGTHRLWVKIFTTKMDNLDQEDATHHYDLEDVPYVQFFDKAIALHGAFWHGDFGHVHSHGCVNLSPLDARWLFAFTEPHLPLGWIAVLPTKLEPGTVIRVR